MEQLSLATTIRTSSLQYLDTMQFLPSFTDEVTVKYQRVTDALKEIGPYDMNTRDSSIRRKFTSVEVFGFYPGGDVQVHSRLEQLIMYLRDGYKVKRMPFDVDFRSFEKEFWLDSAVFPSQGTNLFGYSIGRLGELLNRIVSQFEQARRRMVIPLAIVAGTSHRSVRTNREQYIEAKREFASRDIPCQYASYYHPETNIGAGILYNLGNSQQALGFALWNFALDMYGKVGGLAWVVPQRISPNDDRVVDLSIGLRFVRNPSIADRFYVGYATIIDKFGRWIGVVTSEPFQFQSSPTDSMVVPKEQMEKVVSDAIQLARTSPKTKEILDTKAEISISIFLLDRFHQSEIEGIERATKVKLGGQDVKLGLVSINSDPILNLMSDTPKRGLAVQINEKAFLVYSSNKRGGLPSHPVVAKVENLKEPGCAFRNMAEAANHILATCTLHWQTAIIGSSRLPAPLSFAHNIATMASIDAMPKAGSWLWETLWFI